MRRLSLANASDNIGEPSTGDFRQSIEQAEARQMRMKERRGALGGRERDQRCPVDGIGRERRELDVSGGLGPAARAQQQQSRIGTDRGTPRHGSYDVVLARWPLPKLTR